MRQEIKKINPKSNGSTLINVPFRRLARKFKKRLENENKLCPSTAEAIVRSLEKDASLHVDTKTKVLCYLILNNTEKIKDMGEEALSELVNAQAIEEFNVGKRATKLLLEGLKKYGPEPIEEISGELEEIRKTASKPPPRSSEHISLEIEATVPSALSIEVISTEHASEPLEAKEQTQIQELKEKWGTEEKVRELVKIISEPEKHPENQDAHETIIKLAESGKGEAVVSALVKILGDMEKSYSARGITSDILIELGKSKNGEKVVSILVDEIKKTGEARSSIIRKNFKGRRSSDKSLATIPEEELDEFEKAGDIRFNVANCLGDIGDPAAFGTLKEVAFNDYETDDIQRAAKKAIGKILIDKLTPPLSLREWFETYVEKLGMGTVLNALKETALGAGSVDIRKKAVEAATAMRVVANGKIEEKRRNSSA